jgi:hypothetical protein
MIRALSVAELPPPNTKRWVIRRKAAVVAAVHLYRRLRSGKFGIGSIHAGLHRQGYFDGI